ncbi:MAG: OB-fold nucleic acid binding domain-containing protein, partial [Solirubrobacteraceae bacterium]
VGKELRECIEEESQHGPYITMYDVVRRLGLPRDALANLAAVGVFASLGLSRREAIWAAGVVDVRDGLLPDPPLEIPMLPPLTEEGEVRLDYQIIGCAPGGRHLMRFYRDRMEKWRVVATKDLHTVPHGWRVRVGGVVAIQQRPPTAKGILFMTLEDEGGTCNVVVMPDVYARYRQTLRLATLIAVEGTIERVDGVTNIRAERVQAFGHDPEAGAVLSKHFS